jgi:hypothetical protein
LQSRFGGIKLLTAVPLPCQADKAGRLFFAQRRFDRMPSLATALQEAGCTSVDSLDHCQGTGEHARGCWVLDLVLGKI